MILLVRKNLTPTARHPKHLAIRNSEAFGGGQNRSHNPFPNRLSCSSKYSACQGGSRNAALPARRE